MHAGGDVGEVDTKSDVLVTEAKEVFFTFLYLESWFLTIFNPMLTRLLFLFVLLATSVVWVLEEMEVLMFLLEALFVFFFPPITKRPKYSTFRLTLLRVDGFMANTRNIAMG